MLLPSGNIGMTIVELMSRPREMLLRTCADRNDCITDQELAILVAELFAILHPATLPMLDRMFEDIKQDAENDGELGLNSLKTMQAWRDDLEQKELIAMVDKAAKSHFFTVEGCEGANCRGPTGQ
jgi:hypothetical protein